MSRAYDIISTSLNEIINDMKKTNGANLRQTVLTIEVNTVKDFTPSEIKAIRLQNNQRPPLISST